MYGYICTVSAKILTESIILFYIINHIFNINVLSIYKNNNNSTCYVCTCKYSRTQLCQLWLPLLSLLLPLSLFLYYTLNFKNFLACWIKDLEETYVRSFSLVLILFLENPEIPAVKRENRKLSQSLFHSEKWIYVRERKIWSHINLHDSCFSFSVSRILAFSRTRFLSHCRTVGLVFRIGSNICLALLSAAIVCGQTGRDCKHT